MKNSRIRRILLLAGCAVLLVCLSISATLAYLTYTTPAVNNTFTIGKVEIALDEAKVDQYGAVDTTATARVQANVYKLIPGHTYTKDPTVHVSEDSETCWLFVRVQDGIEDIQVSGSTIADAMVDSGNWALVAGETDVYAYVSKVEAEDDVLVFSSFTLAGTADVASYKDATIAVQAYAVQADGFASAADAYAAAPCDAWQ